MIKYTILEQTELSAMDLMHSPALIELGGCGDYGNQFGLGAYEVQFDVTATNQHDETRYFTVAFQPEERTNRIMNYSGYEMASGIDYGCDVDQSRELLEFCGYETAVLDALHSIAMNCAKAELERLLSDTHFFMNPRTGTVNTMEGWADEGYTTEDCDLLEVFYDDGAWVEEGEQ